MSAEQDALAAADDLIAFLAHAPGCQRNPCSCGFVGVRRAWMEKRGATRGGFGDDAAPVPTPPTAEPSEICETCGAKTVEYKHGMNKGLVRGLAALAEVGSSRLVDLSLSHSEIDNFQKLRYWDLVVSTPDKGIWEVTENGRQFVKGTLSIHKYVWTYRGRRVRYDGPLIKAQHALDGYKQRDEWAEEAEPHRDDEEGAA